MDDIFATETLDGSFDALNTDIDAGSDLTAADISLMMQQSAAGSSAGSSDVETLIVTGTPINPPAPPAGVPGGSGAPPGGSGGGTQEPDDTLLGPESEGDTQEDPDECETHIAENAVRPQDDAGAGHFTAPRHNGPHDAVDYLIDAGEEVLSPVSGTVERRGWAYDDEGIGSFGDDDFEYRIVDIRTDSGELVRLFYVDPSVQVGDRIGRGDSVGTAQDISLRVEGSLPHIHVEHRAADGTVLNPEESLPDCDA